MTLFSLVGRIPRNLAYRMSNPIGAVGFRMAKKHRNIAINNLTRAFGSELEPHEIKKLARQVFKNLMYIIFEIGWSLKLDPQDVRKYFRVDGLLNFIHATQKGNGVLVLTAHMGNWELLPVIGGLNNMPVNVLFRPFDFPALDQFFLKLRSRFGAVMIPTARSMRKVLRNLRRGETIAILMDQNVDWYEGVFVDFFGHRACTNKGMALLALKTGAPVLPIFLIRENSGFKLKICPEIAPIKTGDKTKDVEANTAQYNRAIESIVREYPDQWFWVHQRWKTKPYHPWPKLRAGTPK